MRPVLLALIAATSVLFACAAPNGAIPFPETTRSGDESPVWRTVPPTPPAPTAPPPQQPERPAPTRAGRVITLSDPRSSEKVELSEDQVGGFISWGCRDYLSDDRRTIVEIGRFEAANVSDDGFIPGFILYDGSSSGEFTMYRRMGVNQRWDW